MTAPAPTALRGYQIIALQLSDQPYVYTFKTQAGAWVIKDQSGAIWHQDLGFIDEITGPQPRPFREKTRFASLEQALAAWEQGADQRLGKPAQREA